MSENVMLTRVEILNWLKQLERDIDAMEEKLTKAVNEQVKEQTARFSSDLLLIEEKVSKTIHFNEKENKQRKTNDALFKRVATI